MKLDMIKACFTIFLLFIANLGIFSQTSANEYNFSGTWILDEKASFRDKKRREEVDNYQLIIDDQNEIVKIDESYNIKGNNYYKEILLNTDNKGEENSYYVNNKEIKKVESKSYRKEDKIYRKYLEEITLKKIILKYEVTEKYELSKKKDKVILEVEKKLVSTSDPNFSRVIGNSTLLNFDYKNKYIFYLKK